MTGWEWVAPLVSMLGAGLAFLGAWAGTRQREGQGRREEWGRRFTSALEAVKSDNKRVRFLGRSLLVNLARSELASKEERQLADDVLEEDARFDPFTALGQYLQPGPLLDRTDFIEDNQGTPNRRHPREKPHDC